MSLIYVNPYSFSGIVTGGLVLHLDAGNSTSYPGSGTTWTDLSGSGNNGTLVGGTGYNSANGGSLVFDGTDDYITTGKVLVPNNTASYTVSVWCYRNSNSVGNDILLSQWTFANVNNSFFFGFNSTGLLYFSDRWTNITVPGAGNTGVWMNLVGVYRTYVFPSQANAFIYLNGSLSATRNDGLNYSGTGNFIIGRQGELSDEYFSGNISQVSVYNRELTATEIAQNYNALKGRYGLS